MHENVRSKQTIWKQFYCFYYIPILLHHYKDVIMSSMASQITSLTIVYSCVYSGANQRKHQSSASLACVLSSPVTGEFPAQRTSNAENVSIWRRHHDRGDFHMYMSRWCVGLWIWNTIHRSLIIVLNDFLIMTIIPNDIQYQYINARLRNLYLRTRSYHTIYIFKT